MSELGYTYVIYDTLVKSELLYLEQDSTQPLHLKLMNWLYRHSYLSTSNQTVPHIADCREAWYYQQELFIEKLKHLERLTETLNLYGLEYPMPNEKVFYEKVNGINIDAFDCYCINPRTSILSEGVKNTAHARSAKQFEYLTPETTFIQNPQTLHAGIDWIYTYFESLYMFDFKVVCLSCINYNLDESVDFFFTSAWYASLLTTGAQLFWSVMLDNYIIQTLYQLSFSDDWTRGFLSSKESSLYLLYHPELIFIKNQINSYNYENYLSDITLTGVQHTNLQVIINPIMLLPQLIFIFYLSFLFTSFYFSYYTSSSKEGSTVDMDYLLASITIESEKELGSIDDLIMPLIFITYMFGWYFYSYCYSMFSSSPEMSLFFFSLPILMYIIFNTPLFLLYDFGIIFIVYIKGVTPSSSLLAELLFDYVAVIAYFVRVLIQGVRLVLMLATYTAMHDFVLFIDFGQRNFYGSENLWETNSRLETTTKPLTYFIFTTLPSYLLNLLYEIFHTFFVVTAQLVAYCGMVFWLFLFLFTSFIAEKQESFFREKRKLRKLIMGRLYTL